MRAEILFGPPGTGKTTAAVGVVEEEMARRVPSARIGYFSFTRRAANEAIARVVEKFRCAREEFPNFRTLHSMCFKRLGLRSGDVLAGESLREFGRWAGISVSGRLSEDGTTTGFQHGDRIMHMENLARVRGVTLREQYNEDCDDMDWSMVDRVARALAEFKARRGLLDYTDMLREFLTSGTAPALDVLVIDEAQDQSALQWLVVAKLAVACRRVVVAGDDDQAIYRWAGADSDHMLRLEGESRVLDHSWRVPREIQIVAERIIEPVRRRRAKTWSAREGGRGVVDRAAGLFAADLSGDDVLVLARNTYVLREQVEPVLRSAGVIYERHGRPSVDQRVLDVVSTWEALRRGETVSLRSARVVYGAMTIGVGMARGHRRLPAFPEDGEVTMADLVERGGLLTSAIWHAALDRLPPAEAAYLLAGLRRGERPTKRRPRVRLSTIHGEKGGQARHVVLFREMAQRTHREMEKNADDERRVWYVAATRAQERLTVVDSTTSRVCPWL